MRPDRAVNESDPSGRGDLRIPLKAIGDSVGNVIAIPEGNLSSVATLTGHNHFSLTRRDLSLRRPTVALKSNSLTPPLAIELKWVRFCEWPAAVEGVRFREWRPIRDPAAGKTRHTII